VHHREPVHEDEQSGELAGIEQIGAALGFEERHAQQHPDLGDQADRVLGELGRELVGRVGDYAVDAGRRPPFEQEVHAAGVLVGAGVVEQIGRDDAAPGGAQDARYRARAARRLPDGGGQVLDRQQGADRLRRRLVEVVAPVGERAARDDRRELPHGALPPAAIRAAIPDSGRRFLLA
jgi:hypothetical protein